MAAKKRSAKASSLKARLKVNQLSAADLRKIKALVKRSELAAKQLRGALVE
jgi:hypothetical protein